MNDSVKSNRELLKGGKEEPFERDKNYLSKQEKLVLREKQASPEVIDLIRARAQRESRIAQRRQMIALVISLVLARGS